MRHEYSAVVACSDAVLSLRRRRFTLRLCDFITKKHAGRWQQISLVRPEFHIDFAYPNTESDWQTEMTGIATASMQTEQSSQERFCQQCCSSIAATTAGWSSTKSARTGSNASAIAEQATTAAPAEYLHAPDPPPVYACDRLNQPRHLVAAAAAA